MEGNDLCKQCDTRHVRSLSSSGFVATWATLRTKKNPQGVDAARGSLDGSSDGDGGQPGALVSLKTHSQIKPLNSLKALLKKPLRSNENMYLEKKSNLPMNKKKEGCVSNAHIEEQLRSGEKKPDPHQE